MRSNLAHNKFMGGGQFTSKKCHECANLEREIRDLRRIYQRGGSCQEENCVE